MVHEPRSVMVSQSPWHHTPGNRDEVGVPVAAAVVVAPEPDGMEGSGAVTTSSPCSPTAARPSSSNASTRAPR